MTKRARFLILLVTVAIAATFLWPTINWYFILDSNTKKIASGSREFIREHAQSQAETAVKDLLNAIQADPAAAVPEAYKFAIDVAKNEYDVQDLKQPAEWKIKDVLLPYNAASKDLSIKNLITALEPHYRDQVLNVKKQMKWIVQLGLDLSGGMSVVLEAKTDRIAAKLGHAPDSKELSEAMDLAVEAMKGRVDAFGISEPSVRKDEAASRLYIDIPGAADPERINNMIMGGGNLALQIVDDEASRKFLDYQTSYQAQNISGWKLESDPALQKDQLDKLIADGTLPPGAIVVPYVKKDTYGIDYTVNFIVLKSGPEFTIDGTYINEARVIPDQLTGVPNVTFGMSTEGGEKFRKLTRDNTGKSMAIILENKVRARATIQEEIPNGQVRISGFNSEEAESISKVLKTGALPLDFHLESQQVVGASLGEDAINSGIFAVSVGFGAVVLFMILYYLGSGIIANVALLLNIFFMMAILSVFNLTLTMTSIAGLILTVGMAVDANVLIFERIKEELRDGKSRAASIVAGYAKAFWTIADSNITTLIASVLLAYLGTGPIQGFAVTLTVGVLTSMFTALFVTRLLQDFGTEQLKHNKMSITWRLAK